MMSPKKLHSFNTFIMFGLLISIIEINPISSFVVPSPQSESNKYSHIHTAGAGTCFSSSASFSSSSSASSSFNACTSVSANVNRNISKKSRIRFRRRRLQLLLDNNNFNDSLNDNENININDSINDSINANSNANSNDSSNDNNHQTSLSSSLPYMEEEIIASAKAKLDINRVRNFLSLQSLPDNDDSLVHGYTVMSEVDAVTDATDNSIYSQKTLPSTQTQTQSQLPVQSLSPPPNQLSIALASGCAIATLSLILFHLPILSSLLFLTVTYVASRDPTIENDGLVEGDDITGPITRIVGRATIQSIEQSKPKVKAVARAVISGDEEIMKLRQQIEDLEMENEDLKLWIERRKGVDEKSKLYSLNELKDMARSDGLMVSGTKAQLMMRLMERGSLKL